LSQEADLRLNRFNDAELDSAAYSQVLAHLSVEEKLQSVSKLPEINRARLAEFCYRRVHLRELGLRIAATCRLQTLQFAFGANAALVMKQAADVDAITRELNPKQPSLPSLLSN
jgi:hypothetical protein